MRFLLGVVTTLVIMALSGLFFVHSGLYNVKASEDHHPISQWALHTTMHNAVETSASDLEVPANLSSDAMIRQGARAYDQLCAACHLKPGQENTLIRQGLNPTPPALTQAGHFGPAEQFWVIKHGIRMTGMPAWGTTHEDQDLWELTAFVQQLPTLSEQQYASLLQPEAGATTADDGHDHDHGAMAGMMTDASSHGEPGHHAGVDSHEAGESQEGGHHADDAQQEAASTAADDHYADGHTH